MRPIATVAIIATLAGCVSGFETPPPVIPKLGPEIDGRTAEKDAKGLVMEVYQYIGVGKADNLMSLLAAPLVVFGPRKLDATMTRADALLALSKVVDSKTQAKVSSGSLDVVPAPGGRSAWAVDVVTINGSPLAITAVMTNVDDLWVIDAAALARTPTSATVKAELKKEAVVPPGMAARGKTDPRAGGAIEKFQKGLADQTTWGADLDTRSDPVVIGPSLGDIARGKKDVKKLWAKRLKANVREIAVGEVAAAVTPDGQIAWVTAPVTRITDDEDLTPLRVFAIYEKADAGWRLTALHESLAVDAPGAGAAFKTVAPPPKVEEPKKDDEPKEPKKVAKAAKNSKKKKSTADDEDKDPPKKQESKKVAKKTTSEDDDAAPAKKKKKKPVVEDDEDTARDSEPAPKKKTKKPVVEDDEDRPAKKIEKKKPVDTDEDEAPKKKKKKPVVESDDEDQDKDPPKKKKKPAVVDSDDEAKDPPKKKKKKPVVVDSDDEDQDKDPPKKKKKKPVDDEEDEVKVIDE